MTRENVSGPLRTCRCPFVVFLSWLFFSKLRAVVVQSCPALFYIMQFDIERSAVVIVTVCVQHCNVCLCVNVEFQLMRT